MSYGLNSISHNYGSVPGRTCGFVVVVVVCVVLVFCVFCHVFKSDTAA